MIQMLKFNAFKLLTVLSTIARDPSTSLGLSSVSVHFVCWNHAETWLDNRDTCCIRTQHLTDVTYACSAFKNCDQLLRNSTVLTGTNQSPQLLLWTEVPQKLNLWSSSSFATSQRAVLNNTSENISNVVTKSSIVIKPSIIVQESPALGIFHSYRTYYFIVVIRW